MHLQNWEMLVFFLELSHFVWCMSMISFCLNAQTDQKDLERQNLTGKAKHALKCSLKL